MKRAVVSILFVVLLAGCGETSGSSDSEGPTAKSEPAAKPKKKASCGSKATSDCTPHVNADGSVRVDALIWTVKDARARKSIGDLTYGLGEKADGVFVVVKVKVRSDKDESATLTNKVFQLDIGGNTYDPDIDGTTAAIGNGEQPFFLEDIGPDAQHTGKVVFDVPRKLLGRKMELRLNELGFGSGHAYIRLPGVAA